MLVGELWSSVASRYILDGLPAPNLSAGAARTAYLGSCS